eukprot:m.23131 g.23131  ORF g.23131 m.23131 type:complete len:263 (+) comp28441_c0_seq5:2506-3294(+)
MDNAHCSGFEGRLEDCPFPGWQQGDSSCKAAGVVCTSQLLPQFLPTIASLPTTTTTKTPTNRMSTLLYRYSTTGHASANPNIRSTAASPTTSREEAIRSCITMTTSGVPAYFIAVAVIATLVLVAIVIILAFFLRGRFKRLRRGSMPLQLKRIKKRSIDESMTLNSLYCKEEQEENTTAVEYAEAGYDTLCHPADEEEEPEITPYASSSNRLPEYGKLEHNQSKIADHGSGTQTDENHSDPAESHYAEPEFPERTRVKNSKD